MKREVILVVLASLSLSACGDAGVGEPVGQSAATETAHKVTVSMAEDPKLAVGDTATITESGNKLTVHSYESSLTSKGSSKPDSGFEFSAIEAEGCADSSSGKDQMAISPNAFILRLADGTPVRPTAFYGEGAAVRKPALMTMDPEPGTCTRGFITYQTPRDERPKIITFEDPFTTDAPGISWEIPDQQ